MSAQFWIVPPIGFYNNNSICYFNSLLQSILSCQYVVHYILHSGNPIHNTLAAALMAMRDNATTPHNLSAVILAEVSKNMKPDQQSGQQSASHFFMAFVDTYKLSWFFEMRQKITNNCGLCGHKSVNTDVFVFYTAFNTEAEVNVASTFQTCTDSVPDFICPACNARGSVRRVYKGDLIPEYFVVLYNKYEEKVPASFRPTIYFTGIDGESMVYKAIARIDHTGTINSGHYWAVAKRGTDCYTFDDMKVVKYGSLDVIDAGSYMVFYERQGPYDPTLQPGGR